MKITFIISSLSSGGAERVMVNIANHLSQHHDVYILTYSTEKPYYALSQKIRHIKLDILQHASSKLASFKNSIHRLLILKKTLKVIDADVNVSFMTQTNVLSIIASKLNMQKIIISERIAYEFLSSKTIRILRKMVYPLADMLIVQTDADKENYSFMKNVAVIPNPVIVPKSIEHQKEHIVLAVGRLEKQKGFDKLIHAFSQTKNHNWKLLIAGEGREKKELLHLINTLQTQNITLLGNQKEIFKWYSKASIFVLSSNQEGFPNALLEAMACGTAAISYDCPYGPSEIIHDGINGLLIENQNINKLANAIQRLIDDTALKDKLSQNALKIKEKYDIDTIASLWEKTFKKVRNDTIKC